MSQDEATFEAFVRWLPTALPGGDVMQMMGQYHRVLEESGLAEAEVKGRLAAIFRLMRERGEAWSPLFDKIYASDAPAFRTKPNALLETAAAQRTPGHALDVCMGEGRNAVYLALQGWQVTGFDVSEVGLVRAREQAARAGATLEAVLADGETFDYGVARWDLIAILYTPVRVTEPDYVGRLERSLKPGGRVVLETFASPREATARRPVDLDPLEVHEAFADFHIVYFEETTEQTDWEQQQGRLVRLVAEKS